ILYEKVKTLAVKSILVPNGTEFDLFHQAAKPVESPELQHLKKYLLYFLTVSMIISSEQ
ncbi:MAG: hypothetical protein HGA95_03470, partial [Caldiserica bacterium]|nr:hypothetical protein [Caldisericota bacterium]